MKATDFTDDDLRMFTTLHGERFNAWSVAVYFREGDFKSALGILERIKLSAKFFRLVADEWEGKHPQGELKPRGFNILRAYLATRGSRTLHDVKLEYAKQCLNAQPPQGRKRQRAWLAELEIQKRIPSDQTFRKTLALCRCELRKESD